MRWQLPALGAVGVVLWVDALLGDDLAGSPLSLLLVAVLALLAGWHSRLPELIFTGLVVAGLLTVANQVASPGEFSLANDSVFYTVVVLAPALVGWLLGTRSRQLTLLRERSAELERRRSQSITAARAGEAERVERQVDLALTERVETIISAVRDADDRAHTEPEAVPARLDEVERTARAALTELREVLDVLRPAPSRPAVRPTAVATTSPRGSGRRPVDRYDLVLLAAVLPLAVETSQNADPSRAWLTVVACLGQGVALGVVRRRPLPGVVVLFALATAQTAWVAPLPSTVGWMLPGLLAPFLTGAVLPRRTAPVGLVLSMLGVGAVTLATPAAARSLDAVLPSTVMIALAWWAGRCLAVREARAAALRSVVAELARTRDEQVRLAAAEQRAEMARELHDVGAHTLTVVCLQAGAARKLWDSDRARAAGALTALRELADHSLKHLGESLGGLVDGDSEQPLDPAALHTLAGVGRVLGLDVVIEVDGEPRELDGAIARAAFRVVQESLTNAARHAAHATVRVGLAYTPDALEIRVDDSGPGAAATTPPVVPGAGAGLRGMRERVQACHGELAAGPLGAGFTVHARLPLRDAP